MRELRRLVRFERELHSLFGMFVAPVQVIFLSMMHAAARCCVRSLFVEFTAR